MCRPETRLGVARQRPISGSPSFQYQVTEFFFCIYFPHFVRCFNCTDMFLPSRSVANGNGKKKKNTLRPVHVTLDIKTTSNIDRLPYLGNNCSISCTSSKHKLSCKAVSSSKKSMSNIISSSSLLIGIMAPLLRLKSHLDNFW